MSWYGKYTARMNANGLNIHDREVNDQRSLISDGFSDSPSYQEVYINDFATPTGVWIVDNSEIKDQQDIISQYDAPINAGDEITWNSEKWLIVVKDDMTDVYHKGRISKCATSLKWLDSDGVDREVYFTSRSSNLTNFGIDEGRIIDLGNERRHILIQKNEFTLELKKGKRFIFDNRAWKITAIDSLMTGVVYLVLEEDEIDTAKDNVELRIADYVGNVANYTVEILDGATLSIQAGQTRQLSVEVRNNGTTVNKSVIYESSNPSIITVSSTGLITTIANGSATVTVKLADDPAILDTISVTVQLSTTSNYSVNINGVDDIAVGFQKEFTATIMNNGIVDNTKQVQWYLYAQDGVSSTTLATFVDKQYTRCTIKFNAVGIVKLKAVIIGYSTKTDIKEIKINSLF